MSIVTPAALYLRMSQDRKENEEGIDRQRDACVAKLAGQYTITEFVDNGYSATANKKRPAYERLLAAVESGTFSTVVCWDLDRLTRKPIEMEAWLGLAETRDIRVITVQDDIDLSTDTGRLFVRIKAAVARAEMERKSARHKAANAQRARRGEPMRGLVPYGYAADRVTPREPQAQHIRDMYAAVLDGGSLHGIANRLNDSGVRTIRGGKWTSSQVKAMLRRQRNAGRITLNGSVLDVDSKIVPLVSEADFDVVQSILDGKRTPRGPRITRNWLSGAMTCGVCHAPMLAKNVTIKGGGKTRSYMCTAALTKTGEPGVRHVAIDADLAEEDVRLKLYFDANVRARGNHPDTRSQVEDMRALEAELAGVRAEQANATMALLVPGAVSGVISKRLAELDEQAKRIERRKLEVSAGSSDLMAASILLADPRNEADVQFTAAWIEWFDGLTTEQKQSLTKSTLKLTVAKGGKGAKRIETL